MKLSAAFMLIALSLNACATSSPAEFCLIAKPITMAQSDTEGTKRQIDEHNAKWEALCE